MECRALLVGGRALVTECRALLMDAGDSDRIYPCNKCMI